MCGIVGYVGSREACNIIVSGLHRLEYRGYDSAGVALCHAGEEQLKQVKATGKISSLEERISSDLPEARSKAFTLGIGHTRWATHGAPTEENAHPHLSNDGQFAIVHNGIIENYTALKDKLLQKGYRFESETDSEVIVHLIAECYEDDLRQAVAAAIEQLKGAFGIAVISTKHPDTIVAARRGSPICVGVRDDETIVASDVSAIISHTDKVIFLNDGDILTASAGNIDITNFKNVPVTRELTHIDWDVGEIEKSGYQHFMLKEIHEQPQAWAMPSGADCSQMRATPSSAVFTWIPSRWPGSTTSSWPRAEHHSTPAWSANTSSRTLPAFRPMCSRPPNSGTGTLSSRRTHA